MINRVGWDEGRARYAPLAEVVRSGLVEGVHFGAAVGLASDGTVAFAVGDPDQLVYPRSAAKPMQAAGMVRAGLELPDDLLALVCASHSGEPRHVEGVRRILAGAGLDDSALRNTPRLPLHEPSARAVVRAGGAEASVYADCSGKHAGMLATCVVNGWPVETYLDPDHPLQAALLAEFEGAVAERSAHLGVDGCGAPIWACRLTALAQAFARCVTDPVGAPLRRAGDAMRAHPELVGGTDRDVTGFMRAVPGLLAKEGAEGVYAAALPDGRAVALKVSDGSFRAAQPALAAALVRLGVDAAAVADLATVPVLGHGRPVGEVHAL
jgi:L-asparaginase II